MSRFIFLIIFMLAISFLIIHNNFIYNNLLKEQREIIKDVYRLQEDMKEKLYLLEKKHITRSDDNKTMIVDPETIDY